LPRRRLEPFVIVIIVALALVPLLADLVGQSFYILFFRRVIIIGLAAMSLDLILGFGGLISFGHAAFLGIGAYAVGLLSFYGVNDGLVQFGAALVACAVFGLTTGAIAVRTSGVYFIMITLAFAQMLFFLMVGLRQYGGDDGMSLKRRSHLPFLDLNDEKQFFYLCLAILVAALFFCRRLVNSRFGMVLRGCMENERRMRALGFSTARHKVVAFVIAGCLAGVAGVLLANHHEYVSPDYMSWSRSGDLLIVVVLGGVGTLVGPILGAAAYLVLEEALSGFSKHWQLVFGPLLVLVVLCTRGGLLSALTRRRKPEPVTTPARASAAPGTAARPPPVAPAPSCETILSIRDLTYYFGGLAATDHLSLDIRRGETMAVIGPNGAGKTTLVGQLSGDLRPSAGRILFEGRDVTGLGMPQRVRMGIARSFQITSICRELTALQNVALAVQSHHRSFRFFADAARDKALNEPGLAFLDQVGLADRAGVRAGVLAHGEQRQLELAMALALRPKILLLDEPMAGIGREEATRMIALLRSLKGRHTILLIEHDMNVVFSLADRISVLVRGKCVATGTAEEIKRNREVQVAYLGEHAMEEAG
jgi:branched-chain amino acid transport system permease protein